MIKVYFDESGRELDRSLLVERAPTLFRHHIQRLLGDIDTRKAGILLATASDAFVMEQGIRNDVALGQSPHQSDVDAVCGWNQLSLEVLGEDFDWERMQAVVREEVEKLFPYSYEVSFDGSSS